MWSKKIPINMGLETFHKNGIINKVRENHDFIL
jgi:hypothetical protein